MALIERPGTDEPTDAGAPRFDLEVDAQHDPVVLRLIGELDQDAAGRFRSETAGLTEREVLLDLSELVFIDSTGIGCLVRLAQQAADRGGIVVARGASTQVRRVLELTQVSRAIALVD